MVTAIPTGATTAVICRPDIAARIYVARAWVSLGGGPGCNSPVQHARAQKLAALAAARQIAVMAIADGATENSLHDRLGVTRRTLRQWLGKPH